MALVESTPITGFSVYGVQQKDYTVEGAEHCDYVKAASVAMFQEANAIEAQTSAYAAVLKARQKKLDELGWVYLPVPGSRSVRFPPTAWFCGIAVNFPSPPCSPYQFML